MLYIYTHSLHCIEYMNVLTAFSNLLTDVTLWSTTNRNSSSTDYTAILHAWG